MTNRLTWWAHYNKPMHQKTGIDIMTVHYKNECRFVKSIKSDGGFHTARDDYSSTQQPTFGQSLDQLHSSRDPYDNSRMLNTARDKSTTNYNEKDFPSLNFPSLSNYQPETNADV